MQQKLNYLFLLFTISFVSLAQVANPPSDLVVCDDDNDGFVEFNLNVLDDEVLGLQDPANYTVSYHLSASDADNGVNPIMSPYFGSAFSSQTIYIRVEENASGNTDITTVNLVVNVPADAGEDIQVDLCSSTTIDLYSILGGTPDVGGTWSPTLASGSGIFDPNVDIAGIYSYTVRGEAPCFDDTSSVTVNVSEIALINLNDLSYCTGDSVVLETGLNMANYSFEWTLDNQVLVSETMASITVTQPGSYSVTVIDLVSGCSNSTSAILEEIDCVDTDEDGVIDSYEDINDNGNLDDDDTDNDTIPNYLDDDDDGDNVDTIIEVTLNSGGKSPFHEFIDTDNNTVENYLDDDDDGDNVLTRDEDYNNNGDPTDDDTNMNSIPDYLDSAVALSINDYDLINIKIYPNPSSTELTIKLNSIDFEDLNFSIIDMQGKKVIESIKIQSDIIKIDISSLQRGLYFVNIKKGNSIHFEKLLVE